MIISASRRTDIPAFFARWLINRLREGFCWVPNPFNPATSFVLEVREARPVSVGIYDARGRLVRTLVAGRLEPAQRLLTWDGTGTNGARVASGVYFARLQSETIVQVRRLVLAK